MLKSILIFLSTSNILISMDLNQAVLREDYLDHLWSWKDRTNVIKIVTGMRRCGKSTLLMQYVEKLRESGVENIIYIDFESRAADDIVDYKDLNDYLEKSIDSSIEFTFSLMKCRGFRGGSVH